MRITGKWEFRIARGRNEEAMRWVESMEQKYRAEGYEVRLYHGSAMENGVAFDDSVGGWFEPATSQIHLFYAEERNLAYKAEELAHYFQYQSQGLLGKTESEIGAARIDGNEAALKKIMEEHGLKN